MKSVFSVRQILSTVSVLALLLATVSSLVSPLTASAQTFNTELHWSANHTYKPGYFKLVDGAKNKLVFKADGNLVFYSWNGIKYVTKWQTNSAHKLGDAGYMALRSNGNIVLYGVVNGLRYVEWQSHTAIAKSAICGTDAPFYLHIDTNAVTETISNCSQGYPQSYTRTIAS